MRSVRWRLLSTNDASHMASRSSRSPATSKVTRRPAKVSGLEPDLIVRTIETEATPSLTAARIVSAAFGPYWITAAFFGPVAGRLMMFAPAPDGSKYSGAGRLVLAQPDNMAATNMAATPREAK